MCDFITPTVMAGIAIASAAASAAASGVAAADQADQAKAQADAARQAENIEQQMMVERQLQEADASAQKTLAIRDEAELAKSTVELTSSEAGISGSSSVRRKLAQVKRNRLEGVAAVENNAEAVQSQLSAERQGRRAQMGRELSQINTGPGVGMASFTGGLNGLSTGLSLAGGMKTLKE
ncbi:hypothetical protein N8077_04325 [Myxococcota bacterium]|nr:hypothetical protein [Myxococcota bacterium]